jgi:hypothetical protein
MKALGEFMHARGMHYGIYTGAGKTTCAGYPGSQGFETVDGETFASWGVRGYLSRMILLSKLRDCGLSSQG